MMDDSQEKREYQSIDNIEIRGLNPRILGFLVTGFGSILLSIAGVYFSLKSEVKDSNRTTDFNREFIQLQITNIKQATEVNAMDIKETNKRLDDMEKRNGTLRSGGRGF